MSLPKYFYFRNISLIKTANRRIGVDLQRPGGLIALSIFLFIFAGVGIISGIMFKIAWVPEKWYQIYIVIAMYSHWEIWGLPFTSIDLSYISATWDLVHIINYVNIMLVIFAIFSPVYIITGVGLLSMKKWGRYLALIVGGASMIVSLLVILVAFHPQEAIRMATITAIIFVIFGIALIGIAYPIFER